MKRLVLLGPVFAHGRAVTKAGRGRAGLERGAGACMFKPDQYGRVWPLLRQADRPVQFGRRLGVRARL